MSLSQEWNWGRLVMQHLSRALWSDLNLSFCEDGSVVARFYYSHRGCQGERFCFDPNDGYLHFMTTVKQSIWTVPVDGIKEIIGLLNRRLPPPGYFTVEEGWGITYRTCISMLPIPEEWQIARWYSLWDIHLLYLYYEMLEQLPRDSEYASSVYGGLEFLERMPHGKVYLSGELFDAMNKGTKGLY